MSTRKIRELDGPVPTDLAEKLTALRRRTAGVPRPKDKSEREMPKEKETDFEEFDRRLKISSSLSPPRHQTRLFNPNTDSIPTRRLPEPEVLSDATGSSSHANARQGRGEERSSSRQLFDHRKDDPVRFSVLARPSQSNLNSSKRHQKPSADVSASSTSSYAASISSSTFTLSSTTDGSSASSALFDGARPQGGTEDSGNNVFSLQLKRLYRALTNLETKIKQEDSDDGAEDTGRNVILKGKEPETVSTEKETEKWKKQMHDHKELAEIIHNLLEMSLSPSVPASLRNIPTKYNIIVRLWTYGFHKLLESLRRASFTSPLAFEHLQDFIYYAYTFYTGLLEEPTLATFKSGWLEALGDLARYRMAVCSMVAGGSNTKESLESLTLEAVSTAEDSTKKTKKTSSSSSRASLPARIDDSPSPSIGIAAARQMTLEPEKELWRNIARDWYGWGLAEQPGTGKLHHHLGLLAREVQGEELRGIYHFVKSMTTLHPFSTSRESILPLLSQPLSPNPNTKDLFVHLHGMLFTHIQLDDFNPTLARFLEKLSIEGGSDLEERDWIMMAVINIAAILEYGRSGGVVRRVGGVSGGQQGQPGLVGIPGSQQQAIQQQAAMRVMAKKAAAGVPGAQAPEDEKMDVDEDSNSGPRNLPLPLVQALTLTFRMFSFVLHHPTRQVSTFSAPTLNPYITIIFTFLATMVKHKPSWDALNLERCVPWESLSQFLSLAPGRVLRDQMGSPSGSSERWTMLTTSCSPPLNEDWCMRGMEWVGRKVFERGYWKSGEEKRAEIEVLSMSEGAVEGEDGRIGDDDGEDDSGDGGYSSNSHKRRRDGGSAAGAGSGNGTSELVRRWVRVVRCSTTLSSMVDGFAWVESEKSWQVQGKLKENVERWTAEDIEERKAEEKRRLGNRVRGRVDDDMDVDHDLEISDESDDNDDENDSQEVKDLKARRRYLKSLVVGQQSPTSTRRQPHGSRASNRRDPHPDLNILPYYTTLVLDTNILLTSLTAITNIIARHLFTIIVPLPVIMELDGLSSSLPPTSNIDTSSTTPSSELRVAAQAALDYIQTAVKTHAMVVKVQTTRGNYLNSLSVRIEEIDFAGSVDASGSGQGSRNMDDLILKAAIWQDEHWVEREGLLKSGMTMDVSMEQDESSKAGAIKVVLLTLDRNLRLKSRSRQLPAASENDLAKLLSMVT